MTIPNALNIECPFCGERTLHEVLKGRIGRKRTVMETTVRCHECGGTHSAAIREEKPITVSVIVSELGESRREEIELDPDEVFGVDDELFVGGTHVTITSIESNDRRVRRSAAGDIGTIWAKRYDRIRMKVSVNKGYKTVPSEFFAMPDEEFYVGDIISAGREKAVIHKMKTQEGLVRNGGAEARDIVRIYARAMRIVQA